MKAGNTFIEPDVVPEWPACEVVKQRSNYRAFTQRGGIRTSAPGATSEEAMRALTRAVVRPTEFGMIPECLAEDLRAAGYKPDDIKDGLPSFGRPS